MKRVDKRWRKIMTIEEENIYNNIKSYVNGANDFAKYIKSIYNKESIYDFEIEYVLTQFLQQFGEIKRVDPIKKVVDKNNIKDAVYKDGIFVCPNCEALTFPLALYDGDYCIKCGQHIRWREIVKYQF